MRVLCVGVDYPPAARGGYELHCAAVVEHLRRRGHAVRVLTSRVPRPSGPETDPDVHRELERSPAAEVTNAAVLAAHLEAFAPDAVSWWRMAELPLSLLDRVRDAAVPAVGVVADGWMLDGDAACLAGPPRVAAAGRDPSALAGAAQWLVVSADLRERLVRAGAPVAGAPLAPAGVDPAVFRPRPEAPPWRWRLLYAGRLSPLKGADTAVAALAALPPAATLDIRGDGDAAPLRALARRLGVDDRLRVHPAADRVTLAAAYRAADCVVFPSRWAEPWGLVPLEAMACGVPVVASGTGGSAAYLDDGVNALVTGPDAPRALAAAVRSLADAPDLRARLTAGGRTTAAAYDAARCSAVVADRLEAVARAGDLVG